MKKLNIDLPLLRIIVILIAAHVCWGDAVAQKRFLFDATKAETAANADWVIDEDNKVAQRFPTPDQSTVTSSTLETYWTGALSSWGIALVKMGHHVETLPSGTAITYGNASNIQDLTNYDVYVVDEPNSPFTAAEKTAIMQFVSNGGGLFMISDHGVADRNSDGWDAVRVWNDLMRNNSVQSLPFGMLLDSTNISPTTTNFLVSPSNQILNGPTGTVTNFKFSNGSTMTLNPLTNSTVQGLIWDVGVSQGLTRVLFASARFKKGKVVLIGDSSPADDGTGSSGHTLYNGWTGDVGMSHAYLHLNASLWLAQNDSAATNLIFSSVLPLSFTLEQNYPNPFNPSTTIEYTIPQQSHVELKVFDLLGREMAILVNERKDAGVYSVQWNASAMTSGIYFYRIDAGGYSATKKLIVLK